MDDRTKGYKYCYGKTRIDDKKIRAHRFIWKTLDRKDHGQRRRKFTMSKIGIKRYIYVCVCVCVCVCVRARVRACAWERINKASPTLIYVANNLDT